VQRPVPAQRDGVLMAMDTRAVGLAVVALGGGRIRASDRVDPRVGFDAVLPLGSRVRAGDALAVVHAATAGAADAAIVALQAAVQVGDGQLSAEPVVLEQWPTAA
jgi:thymidine phosphorylase